MTALRDSENFEMPVSEFNTPMFRAELVVSGIQDGKDKKEPRAEIWVHIPEYCSGSNLNDDEFEYDSCGLLYADLNGMVDEFLKFYEYEITSREEVEILKNNLLELSKKIEKFLEENK